MTPCVTHLDVPPMLAPGGQCDPMCHTPGVPQCWPLGVNVTPCVTPGCTPMLAPGGQCDPMCHTPGVPQCWPLGVNVTPCVTHLDVPQCWPLGVMSDCVDVSPGRGRERRSGRARQSDLHIQFITLCHTSH